MFKKESGAEGEEVIGDFQKVLWIILQIYQLSISYGGLKERYTISFLLPRSWKLH